ncbi:MULTISPECIES: cation:proton antiporter [unclassified Crossiella]|uniref:cation:proton antiporter domain-containing protein n=1 Tax=unclassified Crossiella TaxID=2620835 RepID=UPI001FFE406F|nr:MULTISPECIES: cation:proton antiporter [unclassified Crossiella]MCK2244420.1 cation:proton antiporter [Crossiella sp. S99.2]MCK2257752.1 cation:proton antiporter [Crossiella sp. S99.1]
MNSMLLVAAIAIVVRSLAAARLDRWNIGAPVVMVLVGVAVGALNEDSIAAVLNTEAVQLAAEIILAVLLFVDATEVRGGRLWGGYPGLVARVLLIALPVSLALAALLGWLLFPDLPWPVLLLIAGITVPTDFAAAERLVRDRALSMRVRSVLNVEGGYNDGIVSPLFLFALILAGDESQQRSPLAALATVLPHAVKAVLAGVLLGTVLAWLLAKAHQAGWVTDQSARVAVLLAPLLTYTATVAIDGNGFVASFVCGVAFRYVHRLHKARRIKDHPGDRTEIRADALTRDLHLLEDVTTLLTMSMWFVVGIAAVLAFSIGVPWQVVLYCAAALTVIRLVPVLLSLLGSSLSGRERLLVGTLGPRGTTSIVFGLLAFNRLPEGEAADHILLITVVCVLGSVVLHGLGAKPATLLLTRTGKRG